MTETTSPTEIISAVDDGSMEADMKEKMTVSDEVPPASALQDNIARKGKNAYYFAHAHKATGPKWDGKAEPRLLKKHSSTLEGDNPAETVKKTPSFLYHKSNITSYAFLNEDKVVKLYLSMEEVGEKCTPEDITLDWDEQSFSLVVKNYKEEDQCLSFGKLSGKIVDASFRLKPNKIILTLKKEKEGVEWFTINDKGTPDHELV
jgi:hypothetical protein